MKSLLKYLKNYKIQAVLAPLFKLLEACFELFVPIVVANIVDNGIPNEQTEYVVWQCLLLIALGLIGLASAVSAQFFAAKAAVGFSKELRSDLFSRIQSLSYRQIDKLGTAKLITRMTGDVNQIQTGVNLLLRLFMRSPFIVFGAMVVAFTISVQAGIIFAIVIGVLSLVVFGIMLISIPLYKNVQGEVDGITLATRETLTGARVVRAFCKEEDEISSYRIKTTALEKAQKFVGAISALMNPLTFCLINVGIIILLRTGAMQVYTGDNLTQGQVIALYNLMSQILVELIKLANLIITVTKSFASAERVSEILNMSSDLKHTKEDEMAGNAYISFKNVSFAYNKDAKAALENISFKIDQGQTIGIIGGTGSGKTTLVNLLCHFYDADNGSIVLCGKNVNAYVDEELNKKFAIVPQKAVLFQGTIRQNLQWGNESATDEELMQALFVAQAADVVKSKSKGLDEWVEQGGKNFSGGQRQRLTIARALVKKPQILILDDSASALDYATDASLRKALKQLDYKPTVFIISQRTSSIRSADKIVVLDSGKMVGVGTHDELITSCEVYREIYNSQYQKEGTDNG